MTRTGRARRNTMASDPPITLSEQDGVRFLHFGSPWVQGAMRIRRPFHLELDYIRHMMAWLLFMEPPERVLQIGLGAGALTRWTWKHLPETRTTAVECSARVIEVCRQSFALPPDDERLEVLQADGLDFLEDSAVCGGFGVIQVDVYDQHARGPVLGSLEFYRRCRRAIAEPGLLVINLFGADHPSLEEQRARVRRIFDGQVLELPSLEAGNLVLMAFAGPPLALTPAQLFERAAQAHARWDLPARGWAKALRSQIQAPRG